MTIVPENTDTAQEDDVKKVLAKLKPAEIEVDSLGRIIVMSSDLRETLRAVARRMRVVGTQANAQANGSQCGCTNHYHCQKVVE